MPFDAYSAQAALAEAGIDADTQAAIVARLHWRLDRTTAMARRDRAIADAVALVGSVRRVADGLADYRARYWPRVRHLAQPPESDSLLRQSFFQACLAACDAVGDISAEPPGERHIRRILGQTTIEMSELDA